MKALLGKKLGMTTLYDEKRGALPVTILAFPENTISLLRTEERDGYRAVQLRIQKTSQKTLAREVPLGESDDIPQEGATQGVEVFEEGDRVLVTGISKAKGFQGVMKRHGFKGSPHSHGHKHDWRAPGSIGSAFPQHVMKGKKMAGRMGGETVTVRGLEVVFVDKEKGQIAVKGAVPGSAGSFVMLRAV